MKRIAVYGGFEALVDDEDFRVLSEYKWYLNADGYAITSEYRLAADGLRVVRTKTRMHRMILNAERGQIVDHANGSRLDNRRANLRIVTLTQNSQNSSIRSLTGFKGIYRTRHGKWNARIKLNGRMKHLGTYDEPELAAKAYNASAKEYFGEFAKLNTVS